MAVLEPSLFTTQVEQAKTTLAKLQRWPSARADRGLRLSVGVVVAVGAL